MVKAAEVGPAAWPDDGSLLGVARTVQSAWSERFVIAPSVFAAYLAARAAGNGPGAPQHLADLYLACGCVERMDGALAAFEHRMMPSVIPIFQRMRCQPAQRDDLQQLVRERVLLDRPQRPAKIGEYAGRGPLRGWLRVVATRLALNSLRRTETEIPIEQALLDAAVPVTGDPERTYLCHQHRACVRSAMERAMGTLTAEQRVLLRQHFVDGLGPEQIAGLYRAHRVTIQRRLERVLEVLRRRVRTLVEAEIGCGPAAVDSIIGTVLSQVDVSVHRILGATDGTLSSLGG